MIPYEPHRFVLGVPVYMIMFWLSWAVGFYVILKESQRLNVDRRDITYTFLIMLLISQIVSRMFFFFGPWKPDGVSWTAIFDLSFDGYVFFGSFIGAIIGLYICSKLFKINIWKILDIFTLGAAIGMFFGRIGCFFAGCCYGAKTDHWLSLDIIDRDYSRFPTQTISSLYNLVIFIILTKIKYKKRFEGQIALLFFMLYSTFRFLVEFIRYYQDYYLGLTASQWIAFVTFIIAGAIYYKKK